MTTKDMDLESYGANLETADKENYERMMQGLIEKAIQITGKTMEDMEDKIYINNGTPICVGKTFSYPKFYTYLLSPEFVEKYALITYEWDDEQCKYQSSGKIGKAIYDHQAGNHELLAHLLSKI